jgi:hypothetical protein
MADLYDNASSDNDEYIMDADGNFIKVNGKDSDEDIDSEDDSAFDDDIEDSDDELAGFTKKLSDDEDDDDEDNEDDTDMKTSVKVWKNMKSLLIDDDDDDEDDDDEDFFDDEKPKKSKSKSKKPTKKQNQNNLINQMPVFMPSKPKLVLVDDEPKVNPAIIQNNQMNRLTIIDESSSLGLPGFGTTQTLPGFGNTQTLPGSTLPGSTLPGSTLPGSTLPGLPSLSASTIPVSPLSTTNSNPVDIHNNVVDVDTILNNLSNMNIAGVTPSNSVVTTNVADLLRQEASESDEDFQARKQITLKLTTLSKIQMNAVTLLNVGSMIHKKMKLGLTYEPKIEEAINHLMKFF